MTWIAIAVGGALGSMARHAVGQMALDRPLSRFPTGTLIVNVLGCLAIGVLAGLIASDRLVLRAPWREFLFVGVLGGFTTFSAFGLDTLTLARVSPAHAAANVALQVVGGLAAVWIGFVMARS